MSKLGSVAKRTIEKKRYTIDYSCWFEEGEALVDFAVAISPVTEPALIADASFMSPDFTKITTYLAGGKAGQIYSVNFIADTSIGQRKLDELQMRVT